MPRRDLRNDPDVRSLLDALRRYRKVVVWGLRRQRHTHRYIHQGFHRTLRRLGVPVVWTDYREEDFGVVSSGDLVVSAQVTPVPPPIPIVPDASYCLHNFDESVAGRIDPARLLRLQVYTRPAAQAECRWGVATFYSPSRRTLYQPWGTSLLPDEFFPPTFSRSPFVFWVGSIWDNELGQGNLAEIARARTALARRGLRFVHARLSPDPIAIRLLRHSRIAPAIAGRWQVEHDYVPCRLFKNVSYGQLGVSNVAKGDEILGEGRTAPRSIEECIDAALSLSREQYRERTAAQQEVVRGHTYVQRLAAIVRALSE